MDRSATRLTAALAPSATTAAVPARDQLTIDLTARSGALALASARREHRSLLHARDAMDEWTIAAELRPPTVRAYEAAAAELLAAASEALDAGWQSSCAACGQAVRVAAWRWEEALDADQERGQPTARRATCAACRALGRRGGDAAAMLDSLGRLRTLDPATRVIPGHGRETMIGTESAWIDNSIRMKSLTADRA